MYKRQQASISSSSCCSELNTESNTLNCLSLYTQSHSPYINTFALRHLCGRVFHLLLFGVCVSTETETELNVEVAFSEQALTYRDVLQRLKVTSANSPDDKLPVSHTQTRTCMFL